MSYAETAEEWAGEATSERDPNCPTTAEYDADPGKFIWIIPFGDKEIFGSGQGQFRVYTYDTEAKDGYETVVVADAPTMAEAEQARRDHILKVSADYQPIGIAAVLDDIMRRFK